EQETKASVGCMISRVRGGVQCWGDVPWPATEQLVYKEAFDDVIHIAGNEHGLCWIRRNFTLACHGLDSCLFCHVPDNPLNDGYLSISIHYQSPCACALRSSGNITCWNDERSWCWVVRKEWRWVPLGWSQHGQHQAITNQTNNKKKTWQR